MRFVHTPSSSSGGCSTLAAVLRIYESPTAVTLACCEWMSTLTQSVAFYAVCACVCFVRAQGSADAD